MVMAFSLLRAALLGAGVAAFAAVISAGAAAQTPRDFASYAPRIDAVRIERADAPKIDGDLSDPAWGRASVIEEFYQVEPVEGAEPSQKTRAFIMYSETALYVGFYLYETDPSVITAKLLERDAELRDEDAIRVMIDPFGTFRDGYFFATNPNGIRVDALIQNNAAVRTQWNTIWDVKVKRVADGWVAEFEIPFQSISIDPDLGEWGLQFLRTIRRTNEEIRWSNIDRTRRRIDLTNPGRLVGVSDIRTGVGLEAQLFATGATTYDWETGDANFTFDPSANIFYKITPALTGSLTLNTDFADAPLDQRQVNTGRFSLFFPETRDFFLQDAASFEFGGRVFEDGNVNGLPFFSRRIGIVQGRPVDIIAGAKVSGKFGPANLGALVVKTGDDDFYDGQFLGAARASFAVLTESKVGLTLTHGDPTGLNDNTVVGADFQYKNSVRWPGTLFADFAYVNSYDDDGSGVDVGQMAASDIAYRGEKWGWSARFQHLGEDYAPRLGFANRTGVRRYQGEALRTIRPDRSFIRSIETGAFGGVVTDLDDTRLDSEFGAWLGGATQDGDELFFNVRREYLDIRDAFDIAGVLNVPVGEYSFTRYNVEAASSQGRAIGVRSEFDWGGMFDGDLKELEVGLSFRPNKRFTMTAKYELSLFNLSTGDLDIHVGAVAATVALSPSLSIKNDIQYDNISEGFTFLSRASWEPTPQREIFISLGHSAIIEENRFPASFRAQGTSLALRLGHTFRL
jgi:hypothetical protein